MDSTSYSPSAPSASVGGGTGGGGVATSLDPETGFSASDLFAFFREFELVCSFDDAVKERWVTYYICKAYNKR